MWLAALAVWLQVLAGVVMPGLALARTTAASPICHDTGHDGGTGPARETPPAHDCLACPLCAALATMHAVPVPEPPVLVGPGFAPLSPPPWQRPAVRSRAWRIAARPRGPPSTILAG